ncbi:transcription initiation factor IIE2 [Planoprotostelium fungivorum]|uniref:Transcription initiation factor IIE2 n=1 Tax=Planoprotostelium fungivorum TaxID=1890364 RepID=A0A2P6NG53_9EUKA|nr:transcription initiation factor IIE2 [Planoprotostelium fungivorum]
MMNQDIKQAQLRALLPQRQVQPPPQRVQMGVPMRNMKVPRPAGGSIMKAVSDTLKRDAQRGFNRRELTEAIRQAERGFEMPENDPFWDELAANKFVRYDDINKLYYHKAEHNIRSKLDLEKEIDRNPDGLIEQALRESYRGAEADLNSLVQNRQIIRVVNEEKKPQTVVFPRKNFDLILHIDQEFKNLWSSIKLPDDIDFEKTMKTAGLSMTQQEKKINKRPPPKSRKRAENKKVRILNSHVTDMDLTKDFVRPDQPQ